jgi:hypothetical protein
MGEPPGQRSRVDATGLAFAGSMLQTQIYVNDHPDELNARILGELPHLATLDPRIRWVSPLREKEYREFFDGAFLRELGFPELAEQLGEWWPKGGPHWDALARLEFSDGEPGILLVEGKSYPKEMFHEGGCGATDPRSIAKIEKAIAATQEWLGVQKPVATWMGSLYQTANRLSTLHWLRGKLHGCAWLVHLCFLDDPTHIRSAREEWEKAFDEADALLGITQRVPNYAHVFLPGLERTAAS